MNLKANLLKIAVVIALICMLIPVIAAEDVDSTAVAQDGDDDAISADDDTDDADDEDEDADDEDETDEEEDEEVDDEDGADVAASGLGVADVGVSVITDTDNAKIGDLVKFGIIVYNNGPDTATGVVVREGLTSGDVKYLGAEVTQGIFDPVSGIWYVGTLAPGDIALLTIVGQVLSNEDINMMAIVTSNNYDPDLSNNVASAYISVGSAAAEEVSEAVSELPATGNPVALALLAVLSVVGVSLRRKF